MSETKPLRCGIVGAGIAGLGAAIALRRAGHNVEVFERSAFKNEIGAAITLTPNANLILERWGFDAGKAGETEICQYRRLQWDNLELAKRNCFEEVRAKYGPLLRSFHRVDLRNGLRELAEDRHAVPIRLGCEVCHLDCEAGTLSLADGTQVQKDLIVVADGDKVSLLYTSGVSSTSSLTGSLKTRFAKDVAGDGIGIKETEKSVFRTLIPMDRVMSDEATMSLFRNEKCGFLISTVSKTGVYFVTYPCRRYCRWFHLI